MAIWFRLPPLHFCLLLVFVSMDPALVVRDLCNLTDDTLRDYFNLAVSAGDSHELARVQDEWCSRLATMRSNVETSSLRARTATSSV